MKLPAVEIAEYARLTAQLPRFPDEPWFVHVQERTPPEWLDVLRPEDAVLRVVAANKVPGQVLPRPQDVWLALLPFDDLVKKPVDQSRDLLAKRMAFVELLVRLATSKRFGWHNRIFCGEDGGPLAKTLKTKSWFNLFGELRPDHLDEGTKDMGRNLAVLSRLQVPRFMLCVTQTVSAIDFPLLLKEFLKSAGTKSVSEAAEACGLTDQDLESYLLLPRVVEIGLRFTKGKFTDAIMAELLNVIQSPPTATNSDLTFTISTLHFGRLCTFQPKALELLGQRRRDLPSLVNIRLGSLNGVRPATLRTSLMNILRAPANLHRLATCTDESFAPFASALRCGDSSVEELDMVFVPTMETAKWLAFGLFHADSHAKVSTLRLRVPFVDEEGKRSFCLTTQWLEVFKRVLESVRAEYDLADIEAEDGDAESTNERVFVKLQRPTPLKADPYGGARVVIKLENGNDVEQEEFEVIARLNKAIAVVVPGFGVGWAPASAVLSERSVPSVITMGGSRITNRRVKSFALDTALPGCRSQRIDEVLELLKIIGEPLERLDLPRMRMTTENLAQLLEYCPNLTKLNVSGHNLSSIQPLVDAYASQQCKISTLSIAERQIPEHRRGFLTDTYGTTVPQELVTILTAQASSGGPLRQLLIDSKKRAYHTDSTTYERQEMAPLLEALDRCKQIDFVHITGVEDEYSDKGFAAEPFTVQPLSLPQKTALISVVDHHASSSTSPLGLLDASVLGVVLRFSSDVVPRRAYETSTIAFETKECSCSTCRLQATHGDPRTSDMLARTMW